MTRENVIKDIDETGWYEADDKQTCIDITNELFDYIEELEAKLKESEDELRSSESILFARIDELEAKLKKYEEPDAYSEALVFVWDDQGNYIDEVVLANVNKDNTIDFNKNYRSIIIEADK